MTSEVLRAASPRSTAFDIAATSNANPNCARYQQKRGDGVIHVVFELPELAFVSALLVTGTFSSSELTQLSDVRLAVTDSVDLPTSSANDCAGSPYLSYPGASSNTASYANGVEVFCNKEGTHVHLIKEEVPLAL